MRREANWHNRAYNPCTVALLFAHCGASETPIVPQAYSRTYRCLALVHLFLTPTFHCSEGPGYFTH